MKWQTRKEKYCRIPRLGDPEKQLPGDRVDEVTKGWGRSEGRVISEGEISVWDDENVPPVGGGMVTQDRR